MKLDALRVAALLLCLSFAGGACAQDDMLGAPQPDRSVRDREFGVVARHYGLERRVEMLQWQRTPEGRYAVTWSEFPIDSGSFAAGYRNPPAFPLQSRRWMASKITIDGKPLDPEVVRQLGQWRLFRPSFSALPANLAATFQPEGDGLGSADNPLEPHVGDLRIHWRELVLPPLDDRLALRDGRWKLVQQADAPNPAKPSANDQPVVTPTDRDHRPGWIAIAVLALIVALGVRYRRNRISSK